MLHEVFVRLFMELLIFKSSLLCLVFSCSLLMTFTFRGHLDCATKLAMGKTYIFLNSKETTLQYKSPVKMCWQPYYFCYLASCYKTLKQHCR